MPLTQSNIPPAAALPTVNLNASSQKKGLGLFQATTMQSLVGVIYQVEQLVSHSSNILLGLHQNIAATSGRVQNLQSAIAKCKNNAQQFLEQNKIEGINPADILNHGQCTFSRFFTV